MYTDQCHPLQNYTVVIHLETPGIHNDNLTSCHVRSTNSGQHTSNMSLVYHVLTIATFVQGSKTGKKYGHSVRLPSLNIFPISLRKALEVPVYTKWSLVHHA